MADYTITDPHCVSDPDFFKDDCGSPSWAYGLFISWNILSMYIFANMVSLFTSAILMRSSLPLYMRTFHMYINALANFDCSPVKKHEDSKKFGRSLISIQRDILKRRICLDFSLYSSWLLWLIVATPRIVRSQDLRWIPLCSDNPATM